ncbi:MAG: acetolactate synthase small subunit [Oscillospiraceae bacterium]|jgi:acetolactate synthase-1/3 small subunit|nr:acetolactate synthase small subunit [Clostridiales bacterium]MDD4094767.1 acetolactate synthase small subunit [Oscillospiraceae bacterium]
MRHNISILVENHSGVLARVASLFARRGFNIESLAVGTTANPSISRISVSVSADDAEIIQIVKQLHKLPIVLKVKRLERDAHFTRELAFIKVTCDDQTRTPVLQIVDIFRGHIVDVSPNTATIEISGDSDKIEALMELITPFGILEVVRTGQISIERGDRVLSLDSE